MIIPRDIPVDVCWDVWASEGREGKSGCGRAGKHLGLVAHHGMVSLLPPWGCPGRLHPPWPVTFTFPTFPGAWAFLEAALGFDVTPNLWRLVTTGSFLFQSLKWQGFGLQDTSRQVQGWAGALIAGTGRAVLQWGCCAAWVGEGGSSPGTFIWGMLSGTAACSLPGSPPHWRQR